MNEILSPAEKFRKVGKNTMLVGCAITLLVPIVLIIVVIIMIIVGGKP